METFLLPLCTVVASSAAMRSSRSLQQSPPRSAALAKFPAKQLAQIRAAAEYPRILLAILVPPRCYFFFNSVGQENDHSSKKSWLSDHRMKSLAVETLGNYDLPFIWRQFRTRQVWL